MLYGSLKQVPAAALTGAGNNVGHIGVFGFDDAIAVVFNHVLFANSTPHECKQPGQFAGFAFHFAVVVILFHESNLIKKQTAGQAAGQF
jgi:hypothetical protein